MCHVQQAIRNESGFQEILPFINQPTNQPTNEPTNRPIKTPKNPQIKTLKESKKQKTHQSSSVQQINVLSDSNISNVTEDNILTPSPGSDA